jgi:hypothetical protein
MLPSKHLDTAITPVLRLRAPDATRAMRQTRRKPRRFACLEEHETAQRPSYEDSEEPERCCSEDRTDADPAGPEEEQEEGCRDGQACQCQLKVKQC